MKKGSKLFVRIDFRIAKKNAVHQDFDDHLDYVKNIAKARYFIGGGFLNIDGGMILLEAKDMEEAHELFRNDPIIKRGLYRYELYEWELVVLSETIST